MTTDTRQQPVREKQSKVHYDRDKPLGFAVHAVKSSGHWVASIPHPKLRHIGARELNGMSSGGMKRDLYRRERRARRMRLRKLRGWH